MSISVYGNKMSTCTQRILYTAAEIGPAATIDFHAVDFATGQQKSAEHLKRQPFGKVPAAEIDGVPFFESRAICRILAERHQSPLLPSELKKKAVFETWASLESNTLAPQLDVIMMEAVFKPMRKMPTDADTLKKAREGITQTLQVFDTHLGKNDYMAGSELSLVDVYQAPNFRHLEHTDTGKEIFASFPHIAAWWKRVSERPAWKKMLEEISKPSQ